MKKISLHGQERRKQSKVLLQPTSNFELRKNLGVQATLDLDPQLFFEVGGPTEIQSLYVVLIGYETSKRRKMDFSE
jgi:hypothetical protein